MDALNPFMHGAYPYPCVVSRGVSNACYWVQDSNRRILRALSALVFQRSFRNNIYICTQFVRLYVLCCVALLCVLTIAFFVFAFSFRAYSVTLFAFGRASSLLPSRAPVSSSPRLSPFVSFFHGIVQSCSQRAFAAFNSPHLSFLRVLMSG